MHNKRFLLFHKEAQMVNQGMIWLICFTFFASPISYAWNALGHMVIAEIAYQHVKPETKKKIDNLMNYFQQEYPSVKSFQQLAVWPDSLRSQKIEMFTHWHYIDVPFSTNGKTYPIQ